MAEVLERLSEEQMQVDAWFGASADAVRGAAEQLWCLESDDMTVDAYICATAHASFQFKGPFTQSDRAELFTAYIESKEQALSEANFAEMATSLEAAFTHAIGESDEYERLELVSEICAYANRHLITDKQLDLIMDKVRQER
jgi:hypothetical protein